MTDFYCSPCGRYEPCDRCGRAAEGFVSVLVIRHPDGISTEGAFHQRQQAADALIAAGLSVVAATTGIGSAAEAATGAVRGFWGIKGGDDEG